MGKAFGRWKMVTGSVAWATVGLWGCAGGVQAAEVVAVSQAPEGFWDHWGDGRAEIAAYALTQPRYGQLRSGRAIHISVTEDFTRKARVKSDGGHGDEFPVVKLNAMRSFQTGIYDYSTMTSTFVPLDGSGPLGVPTKVTFSAQEWCGMVSDLVRVDGDTAHYEGHSYFDGEADRTDDLKLPPGAVFEDAMPLVGRGLAGALMSPGETREVPWVRPLLDHRFVHTDVVVGRATLTRSGSDESVTVPAGTFSAYRITAEVAGGPTTQWWFESAAPHRLVKWSREDGEQGVLEGSIRDPYWQHSANGDERLLEGLKPPVAQPEAE